MAFRIPGSRGYCRGIWTRVQPTLPADQTILAVPILAIPVWNSEPIDGTRVVRALPQLGGTRGEPVPPMRPTGRYEPAGSLVRGAISRARLDPACGRNRAIEASGSCRSRLALRNDHGAIV